MTAAAVRPAPVLTEDDRRRAVRDLASDVVLALYRAVKVAQMHALENEAVRRQLATTAEALRAYSLTTGRHVSILFARGAVFFGGQPLRASRATYAAAIELGEMLARCGGAELGVSGNITPAELRAFVVAVTTVLRDPDARFADQPVRNVRLRQVSDAALLRGIDAEDLDEETRIVRTYASAVVVLRRFYEGLAKGQLALPRRIKRIAQSLVDLSAGRTPAFLGVTDVRNANHDAAGRAVNAAILAVSMGRQITDDRGVLTRIAMATMTMDAGISRALRSQQLAGDDAPIAASLTDEADRGLPAGTAAVLTALARASDASMARTVVTYEALWQARAARLGPLYGGLRPATLEARIVAMARAYNELVTPVPGTAPPSPAAVLVELDARAQARVGEGLEKTVLRLLMGALGVLPPGTLLALSSGEVAVVLDEGMRVRIVLDATGGVPESPLELDLGEPGRSIVKIVGTDPTFSTRSSVITPIPTGGVRVTPPPMRATHPSLPPTTPPPQSVERLLAAMKPRANSPSMPAITHVLPDPDDDVEVGVASPPVTTGAGAPRRAVSDATEIMRAPPLHDGPSSAKTAGSEPAPSSDRGPSSSPSPSSRRPPDARGTMARAPLPQLLTHLLVRNLDGTLVLRAPGGDEHILTVRLGTPQRLRTTLGTAALGSLLARRGYVTDDEVDQAVLRATISGELLGQQLIADGLVSSEAVDETLREQMSERLGALAALPRDTLYAFFAGHDQLADDAGEPTPTDPLAVIMATVRALPDETWMDSVLASLKTEPVSLHPSAQPERFCFTPEEAEITESIRPGWLSCPEVVAEYAGRGSMARRVIYALTITRHLALDAKGSWPAGVDPPEEAPIESAGDGDRMSAPPLPPVSSVPPPVRATAPSVPTLSSLKASMPQTPSPRPVASTPPPSVRVVTPTAPPVEQAKAPSTKPPVASPILDERRRKIEARAAELDTLGHYGVLGVEEDASRAEIETAYLAAVKDYHPDRVPDALADLRESAARIFTRLTEAHVTLLDGERRVKYDAAQARGDAGAKEDAEVARIIDASTQFQKAEIMLKRGDVAGAEKLAALAVLGDDQPDHLALLGWLRAMKAGAGPLAEGIGLLDQSLAKHPDSDRALCFRGALLKRAGRADDAIRDFKKAAELNPKNLDAVREVRLHQMRSGTPKAKPGSPIFGGLFEKLRKK